MGRVEEAAEKEANKKGLTGEARERYVGASINHAKTHIWYRPIRKPKAKDYLVQERKKESLPWYGSEEKLKEAREKQEKEKKQKRREQLAQRLKGIEWQRSKLGETYWQGTKSSMSKIKEANEEYDKERDEIKRELETL